MSEAVYGYIYIYIYMASVSSYGPRVSSLTESPSIPGGLRGFACVSECRFILGPTPPPPSPLHTRQKLILASRGGCQASWWALFVLSWLLFLFSSLAFSLWQLSISLSLRLRCVTCFLRSARWPACKFSSDHQDSKKCWSSWCVLFFSFVGGGIVRWQQSYRRRWQR